MPIPTKENLNFVKKDLSENDFSLKQLPDSAQAIIKNSDIYDFSKIKITAKAQDAFEKFLQDNFVNYLVEETEQTKTWKEIPERDYVIKIGNIKQQIEKILQDLKSNIDIISSNKKYSPKDEQIFVDNLVKYYDLKYIIIFDKALNIMKDKPLSQKIAAPNSIFSSSNNTIFKVRIQSKNSKKKFDINITYNLQIADGLGAKSSSGITKDFEILKTERLSQSK